MTKPLTIIMEKEMSRKEFLATLGFGAASVMGFSGLLKMLTGKSLGSSLGLQHSSSSGYGSSAYGGSKDGR